MSVKNTEFLIEAFNNNIQDLVDIIESEIPELKYRSQGEWEYFRDHTIEGKYVRCNVLKFLFIYNDSTKVQLNLYSLTKPYPDLGEKYIDCSVSRQHTKKYDLEKLITNHNLINEFINELKELVIPKDVLFKGKAYSDIAMICKMEKVDQKDPSGTLRSLYSKDKMAYLNSFPYKDIFTEDKEGESIVKKAFKKINAASGKELKLNKLWYNNKYKDLLLVSMPGFHFLTNKGMLEQDLIFALKNL